MTDRSTSPTQAIVPRATYRLQLHREFDFAAAQAILPTLHALGISHVYCSPISTANPGSLHGYDVIDPTEISRELGGRAGFERFVGAVRALGMGLLIDQVPNHMGIGGAHNVWWNDVLENGQSAGAAHFFDIDWAPGNPALQGKVMVPVLGAPCGEIIDRGEIVLVFEPGEGDLAFTYGPHRFPLDPRSYSRVLCGTGHEALEALERDFAALPPHDTADESARQRRRDAEPGLRKRFAGLVASDPTARAHVERCVAAYNAPDARERLDELHEAQPYRLAYYRSAIDDINYRRFFDINELAALRIEDERVFESTQALGLELAAKGWVDGLRIDHPDGLSDPAGYFERLQLGYARRKGLPDSAAADRPLYVVGEKIEALHETLPPTWALHGTTGYRYASEAGGLCVERRNAGRMERLWREATGHAESAEDIILKAKRRAAREALSAPLTEVARMLREIALGDRHTRDHGFIRLRDALAEVAAEMPVYRTYVDRSGHCTEQDRRYIEGAVALAAKRAPPSEASLYDFVRRSLLGEATPGASDEVLQGVRRFAVRFQQYSAPVAARGVEDTAFYRYFRLVSLNEVGGDPLVFGVSAAEFHEANLARARDWPYTMLATSTHDNKRAEDVRYRIAVLSEMPAHWKLAQRRWRAGTRQWCGQAAGQVAPSPEDQYLLHQTLLGSLPADGLTEQTLPDYRERIEKCMLKSAREAKVHTTWADTGVEYEAALTGFVRGLLGQVAGNPMLDDLQACAGVLAWYGALNGLSQTLLKYTVPGVPDLYQGTELIDLSLVDPDNRRPVDHALRTRTLAELQGALHSEDLLRSCLASSTDGRSKLWVLWRLLELRRAHPAFFRDADYLPLRVEGERRRHAVAFARRAAEGTLVVVATRKFTSLHGGPGHLPLGPEAWGQTRIELPCSGVAEDVLTGRKITLAAGSLALAELFDVMPLAALWVPAS